MPLLLSESDVRAVLGVRDLIPVMRDALVAFSAGAATQPVRSVLQIGPHRNFLGVMPAHLGGRSALGTKLVAFFETNAGTALPTHLATIVLLDDETGALLAVLDGRYITEARTAAVSALSTDVLARADASVLAILGTGVQAGSHLEAIGLVRPLREVRVWSPSASHRQAFVERHRGHASARVAASATARDAAIGADIVVLATSSTTPVVERDWIAPGTHVCAVGACRPDHREMPTALVADARLVVDSRAGALGEAGDIVIPIGEGALTAAHIAGELGAVCAGRVAGRTSAGEITVFKSLGMAVEDVAAARLAWARARDRGLGQGFWEEK